ncbi:MAG TPA: MBL fold metallo-hydrolase [Solirubrobacterales bacterium]|nr:MBL fold metallo-hydrolase [Solirubrobacterales bacterium]
MRVEWHGHSSFTLSGASATVFVDPFGDMSGLAERGIRWEYPPIAVDGVDLLLVTHEHRDHNHVEAVAGEPELVRSTAGSHETVVGTVLAVASEHDDAAGTEHGANTIVVFELDGIRVAHFGDFGQAALRSEQREAIGAVDLLIVPVGGGLTIDGAQAAAIARELDPSWVVPMHYRTHRIGFLDEESEFVAAMGERHRLDSPAFDTADLSRSGEPLAIIPAAP